MAYTARYLRRDVCKTPAIPVPACAAMAVACLLLTSADITLAFASSRVGSIDPAAPAAIPDALPTCCLTTRRWRKAWATRTVCGTR